MILLALAVGLAVGLLSGGGLMTWWSSRRIEREAARQFELGVAQGIETAKHEHQRKTRTAKKGRKAPADAPRRRWEALLDSGPAAGGR